MAEWKGCQRAAMAQQLQLEEESLARLEAAAAANEADAVKGSVHGGMFGGSDIDESQFDAPNMVKVRPTAHRQHGDENAVVQVASSHGTASQHCLCAPTSRCPVQDMAQPLH